MNRDTQLLIHELNHDKCYNMKRYYCDECNIKTQCINKIEDNKVYVKKIN